MKKKKILEITFSLLAGLALLLILVVLFWLGPTVKFIAEGVGSKALGTPLTIEALSISPRHGTLDLHTLRLDTPDGFNRTNTCQIADVQIALDIRSLFSDTIVIHKVQINSPHFTFEQSPATDNISEIIKNLEAFDGIDPDAPAKAIEPVEDDAAPKQPKQVIVEQLVINDVQLHLANTAEPQLDIQFALEQLSLSLTNGVAQLKNISLSNPGRLETPNVFELAGIHLQLDPATLYSEKVVINDIQVIRPHAFLEQNPAANTVGEFIKLAENIAAKAPAAAPAQTAPVATPASPNAPPPVELHRLVVDDIQIKLLDTTGTNATHETKTLAAIGDITVKLVEGTVQIHGIAIPNPDGFSATNLLHLANIDIAIDPASLFSPQIVINEVFVNSPKINLEQTKTAGNVAELQNRLAGFIPPSTPPVPETGTIQKPAPIPLSEQPAILHTLIVTNLAVNMRTPVETNTLTDALSLGNLNPIKLPGSSDTDTTAEADTNDGPLPLISFDLLTVEPLKGLVQLTNLQVGNPDGFANKNIVQLDQFKLNIDPDTLQTDLILVQEILIDNPTIAYERKLTHDNINALQTFIENATQQRKENLEEDPEPEAAETEEPEPEEDDGGPKVVIEHLLVKSGFVKAKLSALPSLPIPLPKIEMNDIGKEKGGTSPSSAVSEIGTEFYDAILGAVSSTSGFGIDALKGFGALAMGPDGKPLPEITETNLTAVVAIPAEPAPTETTAPKKKKRRRPGRTF